MFKNTIRRHFCRLQKLLSSPVCPISSIVGSDSLMDNILSLSYHGRENNTIMAISAWFVSRINESVGNWKK